ncbi:MAG: cobalamin-dependent protein [Nitrospinae bacterium]|nr:cobalamin-dependent protein [Nitrospinota bacterium]
MRVLLINPHIENIIQSSAVKELEKKNITGLYPPLGILYIASYIKENSSHEVKVLDLHASETPINSLRSNLKEYQPDVVGISTKTFTLIDSLTILQEVKHVNPDVITVMGGRHPTIYPEETAKQKHVDYIIQGEGEATFLELLNVLETQQEPKDVKGIAYYKENKSVNNGMSEYIQDLNLLPNPDRSLIDVSKYFSSIGGGLNTTMQSSRGCPYKCIYCDILEGKKFRWRTPENMIVEIKEILSLGIKEVFFVDDIFTIRKERVLQFCDALIKNNIDLKWKISSRVDTVDEEMLAQLKKAGCYRIHFGLESGSDTILTGMKKNINTDQIRKAISLSKAAGIESLGYFMIGSPGETQEDINQTIDFACSLELDFVSFSTTVPYPATELYREGVSNGIFQEDYWKKFAEKPDRNFVPKLYNENFSDAELYSLTKKAYRKYYLRWGFIRNKLKTITSLNQLFRYSVGALKVMNTSK